MTITKSKEMIIEEKQHETEPANSNKKPDGELFLQYLYLISFLNAAVK